MSSFGKGRIVAATVLVVSLATVAGAQKFAPPSVAHPEDASLRASTNSQIHASGPEARTVAPNNVYVPSSSVARPEDAGLRAHTNYRVHSSGGVKPTAIANPAGVGFDYVANNPGSVACIYNLLTYAGCTYSGGFGKKVGAGSSGAIALVDAYDNPYAAASLAYFDSYWPVASAATLFKQFYCGTAASGIGCYTTGTPPAVNNGWGLEEALDIEYSHAMAPKAKIYLVEAATNSFDDLNWAEAWGEYYVAAAGGGQVSNSWGAFEFSGETSYDGYYNNYFGSYFPVVVFASSGDAGGKVQWPSASPYVVSAGGTSIVTDGSGNFLGETGWGDGVIGDGGTGGGPSSYEALPPFQNVHKVAYSYWGGSRSTPDVSAVADPNTGVWVYDILNGGWYLLGGTSVASPVLAGIVNTNKNHMNTATDENTLLYGEFSGAVTYPTFFRDETAGSNGYSCIGGYDWCTGIGSPKKKGGE